MKSLPFVSLIAVTAIWGWTFVVVKSAVSGFPVVVFLALRFILAALLLVPLAKGPFTRRTIVAGVVIGVSLAVGFQFQTVGLTSASAANAGLLTGLFVVFTPLTGAIIDRKPVERATLAASVAAMLGTGLLLGADIRIARVQFGDMLEILGAIAFSMQIVLLSKYSPGLNVGQVVFVQMCTAAILFTFGALATFSVHWPDPTSSVWLAVIITGALASALAFWVQTFVQQRLAAGRAAIIMATEPAFAAAFAIWLGSERLRIVQGIGAVVIVFSLIAHETWIARKSTPKPSLVQDSA